MRTQAWTLPDLCPGRVALIIGTRGGQVLSGVCRGLSNQEIAWELYVSEDTIKTHIKRLLRAAGAVNRAHLAALVMSRQVPVLVREDQWAA